MDRKPFIRVSLKKWTSTTRIFNTYRELKKNLPLLIKESYYDEVAVYRTRGAGWNEWFEYWRLDDKGKPVLGKHGWC